ncbi:MAG: hypothetical protein DMF63_15480 [Acidobacteria bacterium]|nr:MAG: hypothetical protein DMF63_15480 [Acidobacteriota bacterium]
MPTPRSGAAVAVVDGIIYVMGGGGVSGALSTVEAYDPATDSWASKRPMLFSHVSFGAAELNGIIYALGGNGNRTQV